MRAPRPPRLSAPRVAVLLVAVLVVTLASWYVRNTHQLLNRQQAEIRMQQVEIRADCAFKRDIAELPGQVTPGPALLLLAHDARDAYIGKGCPGEFGPPPRSYPTPTPTATP